MDGEKKEHDGDEFLQNSGWKEHDGEAKKHEHLGMECWLLFLQKIEGASEVKEPGLKFTIPANTPLDRTGPSSRGIRKKLNTVKMHKSCQSYMECTAYLAYNGYCAPAVLSNTPVVLSSTPAIFFLYCPGARDVAFRVPGLFWP